MKVVKESYIVERNVKDRKKKEYSLDLESWKTLKRQQVSHLEKFS